MSENQKFNKKKIRQNQKCKTSHNCFTENKMAKNSNQHCENAHKLNALTFITISLAIRHTLTFPKPLRRCLSHKTIQIHAPIQYIANNCHCSFVSAGNGELIYQKCHTPQIEWQWQWLSSCQLMPSQWMLT